MVDLVRSFKLPNGVLVLGFLPARMLIAVSANAIEDLVSSVVWGVSTDRVSLDQIAEGLYKGRWTLTVLKGVFCIDEDDVKALRAELEREISNPNMSR